MSHQRFGRTKQPGIWGAASPPAVGAGEMGEAHWTVPPLADVAPGEAESWGNPSPQLPTPHTRTQFWAVKAPGRGGGGGELRSRTRTRRQSQTGLWGGKGSALPRSGSCMKFK